ncbi:hypothetical protein F5Y02DRAFT_367082 [Annulohypoxylon stygium]|nr:hypothetical protein F5Y02DRAFT_367082 [Annulohypoxylon stygium]
MEENSYTYTGFELTDSHIWEPNALDNADFGDLSELDPPNFSLFDFEPENPEPAPSASEVPKAAPEPTLECINPQLLSNDYVPVTDDAIQLQPLEDNTPTPLHGNPVANHPNGNVAYDISHLPMANFAQPSGYQYPYPYPPPTNMPYLGPGPGYPVGYPISNFNVYQMYTMPFPPYPPYPPQQPSYPPPGPTYPMPEAQQRITHPTVPQHIINIPDKPPELPFLTPEESLLIFGNGGKSRRPSPEIVYREPPLKRPDKGPNGEAYKNDRIPRVTRRNQPRPNPREWYGPPQTPPRPWGPIDDTGRPLFRYTEYGELERGKTYEPKELRWYMYGPKVTEKQFEFPKLLPNVPEVKRKVRQGLTIWIGWVASQSNERYPHGSQSQRCRFSDCPDPNHTIRAGFPRVIFDERMNGDGDAIDPFHNAGYAHLFCFEKHFDLIRAFIHLDVRIDERDFKREENLGKLSRLYPEIANEVDSWWRDEHPVYQRDSGRRDRSYGRSLSYRLICHTLNHSSEGRVKMRESRAGADMSKHKGDLEKLLFLKNCMAANLVDENGDPLSNAEEILKTFKGKKRKGKALKRLVAKSQIDSEGLDVNTPPRESSYTPDYTPNHTPMSQVSPMNFPTPHSIAGTNMNQKSAAHQFYYSNLESPTRSPNKRDRDDVLCEDKQANYPTDQQQTEKPPDKKRRLSQPVSPEPSPNTKVAVPVADNESRLLVDGEECDGLPSPRTPPKNVADDLAHCDECEAEGECDKVRGSNSKVASKSESNASEKIDKAAELELDNTFDQELGEGDDLFGELDDADGKNGDAEKERPREESPGLVAQEAGIEGEP